MRTINTTSRFRKDYKRELKGRHRQAIENELPQMISALAHDEKLQERHQDHALSGVWRDHRDSHVKPDLVLIYRKPDDSNLDLVRLGSHSELGL
jgi:mRNA interferase YafQ